MASSNFCWRTLFAEIDFLINASIPTKMVGIDQMEVTKGVVRSDVAYTLTELAKVNQGCDERVITNFLNRHGFQPAKIARGFNWVSGEIWNLCVRREMLTSRVEEPSPPANNTQPTSPKEGGTFIEAETLRMLTKGLGIKPDSDGQVLGQAILAKVREAQRITAAWQDAWTVPPEGEG